MSPPFFYLALRCYSSALRYCCYKIDWERAHCGFIAS